MKKFTLTLLALLTIVGGVSAQTKLRLGGDQAKNGQYSWGWTQKTGAEADLTFFSQWGQFNLATDLTNAVSFKLTVEEPNADINIRVNNDDDSNNRYIAVNSTEITGSINDGDNSIELQGTVGGAVLHVLSFVLIDSEGNETQTDYAINWGVAYNSGKYTTTQWAELYLIGADSDLPQIITVTFNEAVPAGALHLKIYYADDTEGYPEIPAGTSASITVPRAAKAVSLQAKDAYTISVKGAERKLIQKATITDAGAATFAAALKVAVPSGVTAYAVKVSENQKYATKTPVEVIEAGEVVIIEGAAGEYTFEETTDDATAADNDLKVSDADVTTNGTQYILANGTQGVGFYKAAGTIAAGKGYLEIADAATAKDFIGFDATATAISSIKAAEGSNAPVYNLAGQRVNAQYKGVVIQNGVKKVQK